MSKELNIEVVVGNGHKLTQEALGQLIADSGQEFDPIVAPLSPDLSKSSPGMLIAIDSTDDSIVVTPSKLDVYLLVLKDVNGQEITIAVTTTEEMTDTEENLANGPVDDSIEESPEPEETITVEGLGAPAEGVVELEEPVVHPEVVEETPAVLETPKEPEYTPPPQAAQYNPDEEYADALRGVKANLAEYRSKMGSRAMLSKEVAARMQTKLLSTILTSLSYGGRKTEVCMKAILDDMADKNNYANVYKEGLINRYVSESFRQNNQRELFKDLTVTLLTASKVGRMKLKKHVDFRRMEALFDNPKHYSNLCTFFAVKD